MRRKVLEDMPTPQTTNAGLWLDKFLLHENKNGKVTLGNYAKEAHTITKDYPAANKELIAQIHHLGEPEIYKHWYNRWKESLQARDDIILATATVEGRLLVGTGNPSAIETSLTLHHTYGVPYIPGSAIKGIAAQYAHSNYKDWYEGSEADITAFGTTDSAGYITFFDALYIPNSGYAGKPIWPDVLTPHHQDYTQKKGPPSDTDSPVPVATLSATGQYLIALAGPKLWCITMFDILNAALQQHGIGAKTSSGYGRLTLERMLDEAEQASQVLDNNAEQLLRDIELFPASQVPQRISSFVQRWQTDELSPSGRRKVAQALIQKIADANHKKSRQQAWYQELLNAAAE